MRLWADHWVWRMSCEVGGLNCTDCIRCSKRGRHKGRWEARSGMLVASLHRYVRSAREYFGKPRIRSEGCKRGGRDGFGDEQARKGAHHGLDRG